jgi:hypothetical protein
MMPHRDNDAPQRRDAMGCDRPDRGAISGMVVEQGSPKNVSKLSGCARC